MFIDIDPTLHPPCFDTLLLSAFFKEKQAPQIENPILTFDFALILLHYAPV
jgi:hypothetical protein